MLFDYKATTAEGEIRSGSIEAVSSDIAITSLQNRGLIITSIRSKEEKGGIIGSKFNFLGIVRQKDIVIISRQLAILFEAKVSILESLRLISAYTKNLKLSNALLEISENVKGGLPMSEAMTKYPEIFSNFYVNMVKSGEESGKLEEIFNAVADYLERSYELTNKTRNALIYPAFVVLTFFTVMIIMLTFVIPKLTDILVESGGNIPFYTQIMMGVSNFFRAFGVYLIVLIIFGIIILWRYFRTPKGKVVLSDIQISTPIIGEMYKKFYLSRITDNVGTLLSSGVAAVRALEISAEVVGNEIYKDILYFSAGNVKGGKSISEALARYKEIPPLVTQMIKTGEETGKLNFMLKTLSRFYKREVDNAVEVMIVFIEPAMIVLLGGAVGILLISILGPIYNITAGL